MTMKKYTQSEGSLEVLRGHEAIALDRLESRFGKQLADFNDEERETLHAELKTASKMNEEDAKENANVSDEA